MEKNKVLIIRFSSFGDIIQCSTVVEAIARNNLGAEIHWITRSEFTDLVKLNKNISKVISLDKKAGFLGLLKLIFKLKKENYSLVYDAHNNLRSNIIKLIFKLTLSPSKWIVRSKDRIKRILLFNFRINKFQKPFKGIDSFLNPLLDLNYQISNTSNFVNYIFPDTVEEKISNLMDKNKKIIVLVPSAAWEMKRWPIEHWKELIKLNGQNNFYILGGKEDLFCEELKAISPDNVFNLAGNLSLIESSCFIKNSDVVISADTGLLHVADVLGIKGISLMGPTAFGFTKSHLIKTIEVDLACRPCSKDGSGKCSQNIYKKCMVDIKPENVSTALNEIIH